MNKHDQRQQEAHKMARIAAQNDRSDPFTYGRVYNQVMALGEPEIEIKDNK